MKEILVEANLKKLDFVLNFVNRQLGFDSESVMKAEIIMAVEEIFVNIASYAYTPCTGKVLIRCGVEDNTHQAVVVQFIDSGKFFNPLDKPDPDIHLSAEKRQAGGLGIYLVKQIMTSIDYEYKHGKNILTMKKVI